MQTTGSGLIQAMEIKKGMNGISSGDFKAVRVVHCSEDGDIVVHFPDGDETVSLVAGDDRVLAELDITVSSGKFDIN